MLELISASEAAPLLGCKLKHVYFLIGMSELVAIKVRGIYRIDKAIVEDYAYRRNAQKTYGEPSINPQHNGYLFDFEDFGRHCETRAQAKRRPSRIYRRKRMERGSSRFYRISLAMRNRVEQLELELQSV